MNYESFKQELLKELNEKKPDYIETFDTFVVNKTNKMQMDSFVAKFRDQNLCPNFYPQDYFRDYVYGTDIDEIADTILEMVDVEYQKSRTFGEIEFTQENAKNCITLRLLSKEQNQEMLSECSCMVFDELGLIAVPRWNVEVGDDFSASFAVNKQIQKEHLHMTDTELLDLAWSNTFKQIFSIKGISEVTGMPLGENEKEPMYVLTTENNQYGAIGMLSKELLQMAEEMIGAKTLFILPSSVHEILLVDKNICGSPEYLRAMVKDANANHVDIEERLADDVYAFHNGKLARTNTQKELDELLQEKEKVKEQTKHRKVGR